MTTSPDPFSASRLVFLAVIDLRPLKLKQGLPDRLAHALPWPHALCTQGVEQSAQWRYRTGISDLSQRPDCLPSYSGNGVTQTGEERLHRTRIPHLL
jgi:hypothetical protein